MGEVRRCENATGDLQGLAPVRKRSACVAKRITDWAEAEIGGKWRKNGIARARRPEAR